MAPLRLSALNHISKNCASVEDAVFFYCNILGFIEIKRPNSFDFDGAWLYNYGVGIHLLKNEGMKARSGYEKMISPKADHISFQCEDINEIEANLKTHDIQYISQIVKEDGILVKQLFFHDPDGHMIEICDCQLIPVIPVPSPSPSPSPPSPPSYCTPCLLKSEARDLSDALNSRDILSRNYSNAELKDCSEKGIPFSNFGNPSSLNPSSNLSPSPSSTFPSGFTSDFAYCA